MIISQNTKKLNTPAKFNNETVSSNVNFTYVEAFKNTIGFKDLIEKNITFNKNHNSKYSAVDTIDYLIDSLYLGYSRFYHMDELKNDKVYQKIKSVELPSESVCRNLLKSLPNSSIEELRNLNKDLLHLKSLNEEPREVMIDFDDTVCTIFGNQEEAAVGYNPRYKGRPSFKEKIAMISNTHELLDLTLEAGNHHSNHNFLEFLKATINSLPENWVVKRIRLDKGFFDEKLFEYCEENCIEYVVKAKMNKSLKSVINYVNKRPQDFIWQEINSIYSVSEIEVPLPSWSKSRRFVLIRKKIVKETDPLPLFDDYNYYYQAIVTNVDYLSAEEIFHDYNQRCNVENKIDELKEGFYFDQNSLINKNANELFLLLKMIAYNLQIWFKVAILPEEYHSCEIPTLRRIFYKVCGNLVGNNRYRHIRFGVNKILEKIVSHVYQKLNRFQVIKV